MASPNSIKHGVMRLPPGFRFHPTDEELVVQYLKKKVFSCPLPAAVIPEIDLGKYDPWDLPGVLEDERYFFNLREAKYRKGDRPNRATRSGYWKATGKDKQVMASGQLVGMKKVLVFYRGKPPHGSRTDWIMHEYRLTGPDARDCSFHQRWNSNHSPTLQTRDWVACRIFKKNRTTKTDVEIPQRYDRRAQNNHTGFIDFMMQRGPSSPSSSSSSCLTELYEESSDGEEGSRSTAASSPWGIKA